MLESHSYDHADHNARADSLNLLRMISEIRRPGQCGSRLGHTPMSFVGRIARMSFEIS